MRRKSARASRSGGSKIFSSPQAIECDRFNKEIEEIRGIGDAIAERRAEHAQGDHEVFPGTFCRLFFHCAFPAEAKFLAFFICIGGRVFLHQNQSHRTMTAQIVQEITLPPQTRQ